MSSILSSGAANYTVRIIICRASHTFVGGDDPVAPPKAANISNNYMAVNLLVVTGTVTFLHQFNSILLNHFPAPY